MKPMDFVKTPKGAVAIVKSTMDGGKRASIVFLGGGNPTNEKNAWWELSEGLEVIDNLPRILADSAAQTYSSGREDAEAFFPIKY